VPSVISAHPGKPEVRIGCRIGERFVIDRIPYVLVNRRHADPLLVPEANMPL
jgi:hypothetical protein